MKAEKFMIFFVAAHGYEEKYVAVSELDYFELSLDKITSKGLKDGFKRIMSNSGCTDMFFRYCILEYNLGINHS
jgi:hypothetical protein